MDYSHRFDVFGIILQSLRNSCVEYLLATDDSFLTHWELLQSVVDIAVELSSSVEEDGVHCYLFLSWLLGIGVKDRLGKFPRLVGELLNMHQFHTKSFTVREKTRIKKQFPHHFIQFDQLILENILYDIFCLCVSDVPLRKTDKLAQNGFKNRVSLLWVKREHHYEVPQHKRVIFRCLFIIIVMEIAYFLRALKDAF